MNIKNIVLGIAIIVLTIFVTYYAINTFFPSVNYNDFCGNVNYNNPISDNVTCVAQGGMWNYINGPKIDNQSSGYCDLTYYCNQQYDNVSKARAEKVFFIALPLGIVIISAGAFFFGLEAVGAGLMGGGVGTLIYGSGAYWPYTHNWLRFLLSFIGLVILIWFAYFWNSKLKKREEDKNFTKAMPQHFLNTQYLLEF
ncbi:MAG: hypothetical protein ABSG05_03110 [Candidatus Pacearchaeota archaeon]|jgi:hypothetical protein